MRWKPNVEEELSPEDTAAAEVAYTFGFPEALSPPTCAAAAPAAFREGEGARCSVSVLGGGFTADHHAHVGWLCGAVQHL